MAAWHVLTSSSSSATVCWQHWGQVPQFIHLMGEPALSSTMAAVPKLLGPAMTPYAAFGTHSSQK